MFRKRSQEPEEPNLARLDRSPSQQVWDAGREEVSAAIAMLLDDEAAIRAGKSIATPERLEKIEKHLTYAMYCFEILVDREANVGITEPLARGCRKLAEGLLNGDSGDVLEGRRLIVHTMLPLEEEGERRRREGK
jgi:hypothetical protein